MRSILDLLTYVVFRAHQTRKKSIAAAAFDTRIMLAGVLAMSLAYVPNFILFSAIPEAKNYVITNNNAFINILVIVLLPVGTFALAYYYGWKKYSENLILAVYERYGDRIPTALAILITLIMVLLSGCFLIVMMVYSISVIA